MKCTSPAFVLHTFFSYVILCEMVGRNMVLLPHHFKRCEVSVVVNAETVVFCVMWHRQSDINSWNMLCAHGRRMFLQDAMVSQFNGHDLYHSVYINPF